MNYETLKSLAQAYKGLSAEGAAYNSALADKLNAVVNTPTTTHFERVVGETLKRCWELDEPCFAVAVEKFCALKTRDLPRPARIKTINWIADVLDSMEFFYGFSRGHIDFLYDPMITELVLKGE